MNDDDDENHVSKVVSLAIHFWSGVLVCVLDETVSQDKVPHKDYYDFY